MFSITLKNLKPKQTLNAIKKNIQKSFTHHLFMTNVTISFSLSATGDVIQQFYRIRVKEQQKFDKLRTRNMTCTGVAVGILCHHWYQALDRHLPGRSTKVVFLKLLLDQVLFSPACILVFMSTLSIVNLLNVLVNKTNNNDNLEIMNKRFVKFKEDLSVKGLQLYIADWVVWPPAQLINFYYLPPKYRVLYDNSISLLYDVYTSHVMYSKGNKKDNSLNSQCNSVTNQTESISTHCSNVTDKKLDISDVNRQSSSNTSKKIDISVSQCNNNSQKVDFSVLNSQCCNAVNQKSGINS